MAFTQSDIDVLKKAVASGVSSVRFADGRQVDYRSVADLKEALALAQADIASTSGVSSVSYASFSKD